MLRVMCWNQLLGGYDGDRRDRLEQQARLIQALAPDVLLLQECQNYLQDDLRRALALEALTGLRGFVGAPENTGMSTAVYIGSRLQPRRFATASTHFHHGSVALFAELAGAPAPLCFASAHLCPYGASMRAREAYYLAAGADPDAYMLLGADFNSLSPHDPEPQGLDALPERFRLRRMDEAGRGFDRRPLTLMEAGGWLDLGRDHPQPTVPAPGFADSEFLPFRCDYLLATPPMAARCLRYAVVDDARSAGASDHLPIYADFDF